MNDNKRVVQFTLSATLLLLGLSIYTELTGNSLPLLKNISLLTEVMRPAPKSKDPILVKNGTAAASATDQQPALPLRAEVYKFPYVFTAFHDTASPALPQLMAKLSALRKGSKRKIRIAWLGDSMIEGDLITQTVRKRLQDYFGGTGVGFVKMQSLDVKSRSTVTMDWGGKCTDENFKSDKHTAPLYLSGHVFFPEDATLKLRDYSGKETPAPLEKSLICGRVEGTSNLTNNGKAISFTTPYTVNRILLDSSPNRAVDLKIAAATLPVYGVSFEGRDGIVLDNFSFRGISGSELGQLDTGFLKQLMAENPYDLVVLEYGANLMYHPGDVDYKWFERKMDPVLGRLRKAMPAADFLIVSTGDRAFKYDNSWQTAIGIDSLLDAQARMAKKHGAAFYNLYQSMGGYGTIVRWADSSTAFANKDYIHPNHRGAEVLGNQLADAFISDLRKYNSAPATANNHH